MREKSRGRAAGRSDNAPGRSADWRVCWAPTLG